jgi:MFS family permease
MHKIPPENFKNSVWWKLSVIIAMIFFLYLADAILSDWIPNYMQTVFNSSLLMGLILSTSSMFGMAVDLIFPQMFKSISSRKMIQVAILYMFLTAIILMLTTKLTWVVVFLIIMGTWGIYYEFLGFSLSHFVARNATPATRSGVWSIIKVFENIAYFLGPIIGSWLYLFKGNSYVIGIYALFIAIAYTIYIVVNFKQKKQNGSQDVSLEGFNLLEEIKYWGVLAEHVWPVLLMSLTLGILDAAFWTTGAVLSDSLIKTNWWGSLFLPAYVFPSIFLGFVVAKMGIRENKKRIGILLMILTGLLAIGLGLDGGVLIMVFLALMIGIMTSIAWPMINAVYSDIISRMGKEEKHMVCLSSSTLNISYIVGPAAVGFLAAYFGETKTMMWVGVFVLIVGIILLITTPRKLRLPQKEIKEWS